MKKYIKIFAVMLAFVMVIPLTACLNLGGKVSEIKGEKMQSEYITWNGRNYYHETTGLNYFFYASSGFTVDFIGTELEATFFGTQYASSSKRPVFAVTVDEMLVGDNKIKLNKSQKKVVLDESVVKLTESTLNSSIGANYHTVKLVEGLENTSHTVTVYKLGEATDNTTALKSLKTDGKFLKQSSDDRLVVEIMGSSGITGHGALSYSSNANETRTSSNSFGMFSLAGLASLMINANTTFMSISGWTLVDNGNNIPGIYDYMGRTENGVFKIDGEIVPYSHSKVDIVIINVGGNDNASDLETRQPQKTKEFSQKILTEHPNAKIIWTGRGNYGSRISSGVVELNNANVVYVGPIEQYGGENKDHYGANNHASIVTQLKNANMIITKLASMGIQKQRTITIQEV